MFNGGHTRTDCLADMLGWGGSGLLQPGIAALAHRGVLFLEEAPAFGREVLDALRVPAETGEIALALSGNPVAGQRRGPPRRAARAQ